MSDRIASGRAVRGGVLWGLLLLLLCVGAGGFVSYSSQTPVYEAQGLVYIAPSMPSPQDPGGMNVLPMFRGFVAFQVQMLNSQRAISMALETDEWTQTGEDGGPEASAAFEKRRTIAQQDWGQAIARSMQDGTFEVMIDNGARMMTGHIQVQHPEYQEHHLV